MISSVVLSAVVAFESSRLITSHATASTTMVTTRRLRVGVTDLSESRPVTTVSIPL